MSVAKSVCLKQVRDQLFQDFLDSDFHQDTRRIHFRSFIENNPEVVEDWLMTGEIPADIRFDEESIIISLETCGKELLDEYALYNFQPLIEFLWEYVEAKQLI